ncbi:LAMI_0E01772g1_1 [Lachancea mirantina]|uniref:LAMI_0E01772g1_1 n=1 Tax=Lachancea mirantina TaxID=1230905 RepID=A0A1G4JJ02_9SACH|nr:LAMI_0E01772g1_1 [Lachancea mirantina]
MSNEISRDGALRRKELKLAYVRSIVNHLNYLGFLIIILEYMKFESSVWIFVLRLFIQSLLASPFPTQVQMRFLALSQRNRQVFPSSEMPVTGSATAAREPSNLAEMPGAFPSSHPNSNNSPTGQEQSDEHAIGRLKYNITWFLLHCSVTFNVMITMYRLLSPMDFTYKVRNMPSDLSNSGSTPSPFENSHGLLNGEYRGRIFVQMIGERIPTSNVWGNAQLCFFNVFIMICQIGLYILTCSDCVQESIENKTSAGQDSEETSESGHYGAVAVIDPSASLDRILRERYENNLISYPEATTPDRTQTV